MGRPRRRPRSTSSGGRCTRSSALMAAGYGVWGMETYLERFWTCLDRAAVRDVYVRYSFSK